MEEEKLSSDTAVTVSWIPSRGLLHFLTDFMAAASVDLLTSADKPLLLKSRSHLTTMGTLLSSKILRYAYHHYSMMPKLRHPLEQHVTIS